MFNTVTLLTLLGSCIAGLYDLKTNRIPNLITLPLILTGLINNTYSRGYTGLQESLLGIVILTSILFIPFALGGLGAGDVKLMIAIASLNGVSFGIFTLLYSSIIGALIALGLAVYRGQLGLTIFAVSSSLLSLGSDLFKGKKPQSDDIITMGIKFPYGLAIFLGTLATYLMR